MNNKIVSVTLLFFLIIACTIELSSSEPAQYTINKLIGPIAGDGKPKEQVGFYTIYTFTIAPLNGQMIVNENGAVKQFSLDSGAQGLVSVIPGLKIYSSSSSVNGQSTVVSNSDGSELYYLEENLIKRWKSGVVSVIAGNGVIENIYYLNETVATQTFLNSPTSLVYQDDCLYIAGYGIAKLNLTTGMISTTFRIGFITDMSISTFDGYMYYLQNDQLKRCSFSSGCLNQENVISNLFMNTFTLSSNRNELFYFFGNQIYRFNITTRISTSIYQISSSNTYKLAYRNDMIYFAEGFKIKKKSVVDGSLSVEAGNGYYGYVAENVPSLQAGTAGYTVSSIALRNGEFPGSISFSKNGELHFVDYSNIVRKLSDNGNLSYVGGNPSSFVSSDGTDASKAIISPSKVIEIGNELIILEYQKIRKVSSEGTISTIIGGGIYPFVEGALATNTSFTSLQDVAVSPIDNSIYFIDANFNAIRKLTSTGTVITLFSTSTYINAIGIDQTGIIYYSTSNSIGKLNPETLQQQLLYYNTETSSYFSVSNSGNIYYFVNCKIVMIGNGTLNALAGTGTCLTGSLFDGMNATQDIPNVYSVHYSNHDNQLYFSTVNGIWKIVDGFIHKVVQSIPMANVTSTDSSKFLSLPSSLLVKSNGDILFIDGTIIRKYDVQQDRIDNLYIGDGSIGPFSNTFSYYYFTTFCENELVIVTSKGIRRINSETSIMTPVTFPYQFTTVRSFISCLNNNLYFLATNLQSIKKVSLLDGSIDHIAGIAGSSSPSPDGSIAKYSKIVSLINSRAFVLPNQEVLYFEGLKLRKIGLDGKWQTIAGNGNSGTTPDFSENAKNVPLTIAFSYAYSELSGTIYLSSNGIYSLTPYCRDGYQFENSFKTSCIPIPVITCFGKLANDSSVCSSRGTCTGMDNCQCSNLYISSDCSVSLCQTENGKQNTILCPPAPIPSQTGTTNQQVALNVTESRTEIVKDLTSIDSKNITFTSSSSVQITLPSTISSYVSNQISTNETIQIISAISEKTQIKPQSSNTNTGSDDEKSTISTVEVVSKVVSLLLLKQDGEKIQVTNLINPITFTFSNLIIQSFEKSNLTCSYLDETSKEWKSDGLNTFFIDIQSIGNEKQLSINCQTNHLTSFAVIDMNLKKGSVKTDTLPTTQDNTVVIAAVVSSVVGVLILVGVISIIIIASVCLIRRRKLNSKE
ncbi:predicted protein [Naegleria gruberi]|uniref:Predicted protein n=1 Tax=Naegleria gruberi TaxID=5762 RepID=D2VCH1_NAEGR|nr:uncharacterized protein NAEGRDRAFT_66569 [Naegleria gruberi]EFC45308.1 predicted protein [Naegleria gruberi]|eukprot:XP_002678052.1 predicted protein [Naegleria gruberi strain NEG-M]